MQFKKAATLIVLLPLTALWIGYLCVADMKTPAQNRSSRMEKFAAERKTHTAADRQSFARGLEYTFLNVSKMDTKCTAIGEDAKTLRIEYVLMGRVLANETSKDSDFIESVYRYGFTLVVYTDGYDGIWTQRISD